MPVNDTPEGIQVGLRASNNFNIDSVEGFMDGIMKPRRDRNCASDIKSYLLGRMQGSMIGLQVHCSLSAVEDSGAQHSREICRPREEIIEVRLDSRNKCKVRK